MNNFEKIFVKESKGSIFALPNEKGGQILEKKRGGEEEEKLVCLEGEQVLFLQAGDDGRWQKKFFENKNKFWLRVDNHLPLHSQNKERGFENRV